MANKKKTNPFAKADKPKSRIVRFYMTEDEFTDIKKQIDSLNGMTISKYCRYHVLGKKIVSDTDAKLIFSLSQMGGQISKLGGLQKQLFSFSPGGQTYALNTLKILKEISVALFEITSLVRRIKAAPANQGE